MAYAINVISEEGKNVDEILRSLKALQIPDKYDVALSKKWPNNYLIKDHLIVPPSKDETTGKERMEGGCFKLPPSNFIYLLLFEDKNAPCYFKSSRCFFILSATYR